MNRRKNDVKSSMILIIIIIKCTLNIKYFIKNEKIYTNKLDHYIKITYILNTFHDI